ncbi:MAG TPA: 4Fe-4S binding protein [Candidatus Anaerotruncus excrementipullorum]|uniref:4Fe-4S binding protein n=1 Tax=Candidatus Anaerotruncus excrementipullorum TaxID=2838465 RepID=A0A9D1WSY8_9FIRM|nr:4Fe-4S binding protein [Candidatus Anaerotruncus excrementipullorum]
MVRKIIQIDQEKCNGCGACAQACQEGAIGMVGGKAQLLRDDYCDGLGNCLPACPTGAITFVEREAAAFDEAAVAANQRAAQNPQAAPQGCPGSQARQLSHRQEPQPAAAPGELPSQLRQWPVQIKLAPVKAPYFDGAHLLVAADCTAYAYGDFHRRFIRGRVTLIGCPKLDGVDYTEKLTQILAQNEIRSLTILRMEVPCCGGLERAATQALQASGRFIPWQVVTISTDGRILEP